MNNEMPWQSGNLISKLISALFNEIATAFLLVSLAHTFMPLLSNFWAFASQ